MSILGYFPLFCILNKWNYKVKELRKTITILYKENKNYVEIITGYLVTKNGKEIIIKNEF